MPTVSDHESHEHLVEGCPECDAQMNEMIRIYGTGSYPNGYDRDTQEAMEADRELMRDEFHVR